MSRLVNQLKIFENCEIKNEIKYYHVHGFNDRHKCALFVTSDDKVYGIYIPERLMTLSYNNDILNEVNNDLENSKPIQIKELSERRIKEFFFGCDFVLALSEENMLYSWGYNNYGQLGRSTETNYDRDPREINFFTNRKLKIKQVCVHFRTVMVLFDNGKVVVWGDNEFGLTGKSRFGVNLSEIFDWKRINNPKELNSLNEIEFIYMNKNGCFAIDKNYNVYTWGEYEHSSLAEQIFSIIVNKYFLPKPKFSEILTKLKITTIRSNIYTYFLSFDGILYVFGLNLETNNSKKHGLNLNKIGSSLKQLEFISYGTRLDAYNFSTEQAHDENSIIVVLSDKQKVFEVYSNVLTRTEYKSIEEYSVLKYGVTFKTFPATAKDSDIKLTEIIGHGGFGKVYKIFFQTQYYAIKKMLIIEQNISCLDKNSELRIMKKLKSDFVVKLYDYWFKSENDFKFLYMQMELCDQNLKDIIFDKNKSFPPIIDYMIRTEIFRQLLEALKYLHSMTPKVIHRDIKPSDVLIKYFDDRAQCKLCDFGFSKILEKESSNTSAVGTSGYRAPEILTNNYNEKVDIFSLGIVILELFGNSDRFLNVDSKIQNKYENLKSVINKMIYSPPEDRPSAVDILYLKSEWTIEPNDEVTKQVYRVKMDKSNSLLKFLEFRVISQTNGNGSIISDINLTDEIGHGGFGTVYRVLFQSKYYAIKKISLEKSRKSYLDKNSELQIMKQLKSDFVVNLYDYWTKIENEMEFLYIQMELCDQTLRDIIVEKETTFPPLIDYMIKTEIFRQLLEALNYLHSMTPKVIHRDIKPSNVLIKYYNDHAQLKLADFGLSKILVENKSDNTSGVGTAGYSAPEIRTNNYDEKVDIYSLGVTILELFKNISLTKDDEKIIYSKLKNVINRTIYSAPQERPSAREILDEKPNWSIRKNVGIINLIEKTREEKNHALLKFLYNYSNL